MWRERKRWRIGPELSMCEGSFRKSKGRKKGWRGGSVGRVLATKPDGLRLMLRTYIGEGENQL